VLSELGILDDIEKVSGQPTRMQRVSSTGELLGALDMLKLNGHMGYPSLSVLRRDLMRILVSRLTSMGVAIKYGHTLQRLESSTDHRATAYFDNGFSIRPDILVGADGRMNSIARQFINHDNRPVYQGFLNWIGVFESDEPVFEEIAVSDCWGVGERFGIVPINANRAYWAGGIAASEIGPRNPDEYKAELQNVFSGWPDPVSRIIAETPVDRINKIYVHDHDPVDSWHRDNVLMIGDAAHAPLPTSGQGACQALEDAWHLANLMEQDIADLNELFDTFTKLRQAKTTGITLGARLFASSLFNIDANYCQQRNESSKTTDFDAAVAGMAKGWASGLPIGSQ